MKKNIVMAAALMVAGFSVADVTIDFDALSTTGANSYDMPSVTGTHNWSQQGVEFSRTFTDYGGGFTGWDGMTYSSVNDTTTPGFGNQYAVYGSGTDRSGTGSYAVFYQPWSSRNSITLPVATTVQGFYANNTTYAARSILNGEAPARAFTLADLDYFKLTIEGFDAAGGSLGVVDHMLADYSNGSEELVTDWDWVDLSGLGTDVKALEFSLTSTDNGPYGMNTPSYFAMDELTIAAIPEPGTVTLMLLGSVGMVALRRKRKHLIR